MQQFGVGRGKNCAEAESIGKTQVHGERWALAAKGCVAAHQDPQESHSLKLPAARKCRNKKSHVANGKPWRECVWEHIAAREQEFTPKGDLR